MIVQRLKKVQMRLTGHWHLVGCLASEGEAPFVLMEEGRSCNFSMSFWGYMTLRR